MMHIPRATCWNPERCSDQGQRELRKQTPVYHPGINDSRLEARGSRQKKKSQATKLFPALSLSLYRPHNVQGRQHVAQSGQDRRLPAAISRGCLDLQAVIGLQAAHPREQTTLLLLLCFPYTLFSRLIPFTPDIVTSFLHLFKRPV